jgi:hypothetical protein
VIVRIVQELFLGEARTASKVHVEFLEVDPRHSIQQAHQFRGTRGSYKTFIVEMFLKLCHVVGVTSHISGYLGFTKCILQKRGGNSSL